MAEVTSLLRQHKTGFQPDPEVVKMLEDALALAREGKIRAVATAVVYHDDLVPDGETGAGWALTPGTRFALTYAVEKLQFRLAHGNHLGIDA